MRARVETSTELSSSFLMSGGETTAVGDVENKGSGSVKPVSTPAKPVNCSCSGDARHKLRKNKGVSSMVGSVAVSVASNGRFFDLVVLRDGGKLGMAGIANQGVSNIASPGMHSGVRVTAAWWPTVKSRSSDVSSTGRKKGTR